MAPQLPTILLDDKDSVNEPQRLENNETPISTQENSTESSNSPISQQNENMADIHPMTAHQSSLNDGDDPLLKTHETDLTGSRSTIPVCPVCNFVAETREEYDMHIPSHCGFKCKCCSFMTYTKGRLENHMRIHREAPENCPLYSLGNSEENGNLSSSGEDASRGSKKDRTIRCKTCDFVGKSKSEVYAHLRKRVCFTGPLLECEFEECEFCTRYKHHFEYHQRNHYGSKPFKCDQCNYACVNQSMLNSHTKSHSSQYPYKCKNCTYATKYLHSIKMHAKKYNHEPANVLNPDGTVSQHVLIDANGKPRGSKSKKSKSSNLAMNNGASTSTVTPPPLHSISPSASYSRNPAFPSSNQSPMYSNPMYNNVAGNGFYIPPNFNSAIGLGYFHSLNFKCPYFGCDYSADSRDSSIILQHLGSHINIPQNSSEEYARISNDFPRERHVIPEDTRDLNSCFQSINGSILRPWAYKAFQSVKRESADSSHIPMPYKLSESYVEEFAVRRGVSPPLSYRNISPLSMLERQNEDSRYPSLKNFLDDCERFHASRGSSTISPPSMELTRDTSISSIDCEGDDDSCSPLDLTVTKPKVADSSTATFEQSKIMKHAERVSIQPQRTIKNRRKGQAFKIDQSTQY